MAFIGAVSLGLQISIDKGLYDTFVGLRIHLQFHVFTIEHRVRLHKFPSALGLQSHHLPPNLVLAVHLAEALVEALAGLHIGYASPDVDAT